MNDWWAEIEDDIIRCLKERGASSPGDVGRRVGMSEAAVSSLLSGLAREGRVRICLVAPTDGAEAREP